MDSPFPSNYTPTDERFGESRYFNAKKISDGNSIEIRLCGTEAGGHVICGYQYFTMEGRPRRFAQFPRDYMDDIGLSYEAKRNGTGEKAQPAFFLCWAALMKGADEPVIFDISQPSLQTAIEQTLALEDYMIPAGEPANFYLTISKIKKNNKTSYSAIPTLKAVPKTSEAYKTWSDNRDSIWLPALFEGGDPFGGRPSGAPAEQQGSTPVTGRDELGADEEIAEPVATGW
jgi:hypothetical protein